MTLLKLVARLFGPSLREQALAAISSHPPVHGPDAHINPIYVTRFNEYLNFVRTQNGNGYDVALHCALADAADRMNLWLDSFKALPDRPDQGTLESLARTLRFDGRLMVVARSLAKKAIHGRDQAIVSSIGYSARRVTLGTQLLREKGWLGGYGEEPVRTPG